MESIILERYDKVLEYGSEGVDGRRKRLRERIVLRIASLGVTSFMQECLSDLLHSF